MLTRICTWRTIIFVYVFNCECLKICILGLFVFLSNIELFVTKRYVKGNHMC